jgi:hypothetical protein
VTSRTHIALPLLAATLVVAGCPAFVPPMPQPASGPQSTGPNPIINIDNHNEAKAEAKSDSSNQQSTTPGGYTPSPDPTPQGTPVPQKPNANPTVASVTASAASITTGATTALTASASDPEGDTLTYAWSA